MFFLFLWRSDSKIKEKEQNLPLIISYFTGKIFYITDKLTDKLYNVYVMVRNNRKKQHYTFYGTYIRR